MKFDIPVKMKGTPSEKWYPSLSESNRIILNRYLENADLSSSFQFFRSVSDAALKDDNPSFAVFMCEECSRNELSGTERFDMNELLIDAYIGVKRYDDAKFLCEENLKLFPSVSEKIISRNGSLPEKLNCRNRYIDIVVGIESGYDEAFALLERFFDMDLITKEDLAFRKQSLKIHRLQRSFDGVYTYSYKK
ncbi:MAG: hypothetical protein FWD37_03175 [Methanomassiliicoccaceae archaeon]|nr:hypothetical protein [Methanomassiliicoccaceae archaeon]